MSRSTSSRSVVPGRLRRATWGVLLVAVLGAATACGGSTEASTAAPTSADAPAPPSSSAAPAPSGSESGVQTITATEEDFSISVDEDSVSAGSYEIEVVNAGGASHDLVVERDGEDVAATEILSPGGSETLTVDLEPGEYVFYCSVGAHRSMGMEITIEVI